MTGDESKNNWWLALITLGRGVAQQPHHYQSSRRQGFFWWEVDFSYYVLKVLSWVGLVWDLRAPPQEVVRGERRLGRKVVEKVACDVAGSFPVERMACEVGAASRYRRGLDELHARFQTSREEVQARLEKTRADATARPQKARDEALALLHELHLPEIPSSEEIRSRIAEQYPESPSLDDIAARAREILVEQIWRHLDPDLQAG